MNIEETKEAISVMQEYLTGEVKLEFRFKGTIGKWKPFPETEEPVWDWLTYEYRIRRTPDIRCYSFDDLRGALKEHGGYVQVKGETEVCCIASFNSSYVDIMGKPVIDYEVLKETYVWFDDGSPCGIPVLGDSN